MIPYSWWRPDQAGPTGFSPRIEGVLPQANGYGPFPQIMQADGAEALPDDPRGTISVQKADGSWAFYAWTATTFQEMQSDFSWVEIEDSRTLGDGYDVNAALFYGQLINTDAADGMKAYDVEAGGTNDAISGAPSARSVFSSNDVLVALGDTDAPRHIACCAIGNYAVWSGSGALNFDFPDGGACIGGADLKNKLGIVFQESSVRVLQFGAGPSTFVPSVLASDLGCVHERTIVPTNGAVAWWSINGPWLFDQSGPPVPIGEDKINNWAIENIGRDNFAGLQGTVDPSRNVILWRIDNSRLLALSLKAREFSLINANTTALARIATPAIAISALSGTIAEQTGTISDYSGGSAPVLGALNLNRKYSTFTGGAMAATLETAPQNSPRRQRINRATPIDDASGGTLALGTSESLSGSLTWRTGISRRSNGSAPVSGAGMNVAFRRTIPAAADWSYAMGVDHIEGRVGGR